MPNNPTQLTVAKELLAKIKLEDILTRDTKIWWQLRNNSVQKNRIESIVKRLKQSCQSREQRAQQKPDPLLKGTLPIHEHIEAISKTIREHQVVILCGDTGSGKTTQLPQICLACGLGTRGLIGHTQPRRIAARSVADRIAQEMNTPLGVHVGYKVRFDDKHKKDHYIKLMTDGILLSEIQEDPYLNQYEVIIIDEAHERSLNIDFILGHLKSILKKRHDLRVIITSATINPEAFSDFFENAPILNIPGRTFPVEHYFETDDVDKDSPEELTTQIRNLVTDLLDSPAIGDILIFLPGERHIREVSKSLHRQLNQNAMLLPLYSRLSPQQQKQVFQSSARVKVILATNVAETSLTVPGIRYVIDSGLARISRYSVRSKIQRLPIEKVSKASIRQRAGRCGRTAPGTCFHLYTQHDHDQRPDYTEPEILRTNLAEVILRMTSAKLGDIDRFPFIDTPDKKAVNDGYRLLRELRALNTQNRLTKTGKIMASFPLDPRLSRILVESKNRNCCREMVIIISALATGDVRLYPREQLQAATLAHRRFQHEKSDFMGLLALWDHLYQSEAKLSGNRFRRSCEREFISYLRWKEWRELHNTLIRSAKEKQWALNSSATDYNTLHQCLLTGFIDHIGKYDKEESCYSGLRNRSFSPHPQSYLKQSNATWIMAAALIETSNVFAHTCAEIEADWIQNTAQHLIKYRYSEPYWDQRSGFVRSTETASLHGLVLHADKKVSYQRIDRSAARKTFIQNALVQSQLGLKADFTEYNNGLLHKLQSYANKLRQPYLEPDHDTIFKKLDAIIPNHVCSRQSFEQWYQEKKPDNDLKFPASAIFQSLDEKTLDQHYPNMLQIERLQIPVIYEFDPQSDADGIHLLIDAAIVNHLNPDYTEWTIQPWLTEKLNLILRSLAKQERKKLSPMDATIDRFIQEYTPFQCGFYQSLCDFLYKNYQIKHSIKQLQLAPLPAHLRPHYRLINDGEEVMRSEHLTALQQNPDFNVDAFTHQARTEKLTDIKYKNWTMGALSNEVVIRKGQHQITVYPALVDKNDAVIIRNFSRQKEAEEFHIDGVIRLLQLMLRDSTKFIKKQIIDKSRISLLYRFVDTDSDFTDEFLYYLTRTTFIRDHPAPRDEESFHTLILRYKSEFVQNAQDSCEQLKRTLESFHNCREFLKDASRYLNKESETDMHSQLQHLLYPGFLYDIDSKNLYKLDHYLQSIKLRIQKAQQKPDAELQRCRQIQPLWSTYSDLDKWHSEHEYRSLHTPALHWLLQDYRVHLFTQEIQKNKVSLKAIEKQLETAKREKLLADS